MGPVIAAQSARPPLPVRLPGVALLVLCALLVTMQLYVCLPITAVLGRQLHGSATIASSVVLDGYALGFLVFGPLADRFGRRRVLLVGMAAMAVLTLAVALSGSVTEFGVLRFLQGFAGGAFSPSALSYLGDALPLARGRSAIGAVSTSYLLAGVLGQVYGTVGTNAIGWRWTFVLAALALAATTSALAATLSEVAARGPAMGVSGRFRYQASFAVRGGNGLPILAVFTLMCSFVGMYAALTPHLESLGLSASDGVLVRLAAVPGMLVAPAAGPICRRIGVVRAATVAYAAASVALLVETSARHELLVLVLATNVFVAGVALGSTAMVTVFGDRAAPHRGTGTSVYGFVAFLGASAAPYLADALGFVPVLLLLAALLAAGAVSVACTRGLGRQPSGVPQPIPAHER